LLPLGIIGEYLGRIFTQTKSRPNYLIQEDSLINESMATITKENSPTEQPIGW
jgi:hypothetical protein